ncbi:MAG: response regulator [Polyangiaceae bacterium]|jgi:DNA-binding response OmpR family regulator
MSNTAGPKDPKAAASTRVPPQAPKPAAMPNAAAPVVLVVDDDSAIRTMLVRALGTTYIVYEASDGLEARELLDRIPTPDAIVSDIMMPRLDGLGLAKLLRKDATLQRVPLLFLTARGSPIDLVGGINAGARHYVTKPFKITEVLAKIATMTKKR